MFNFAIKNGMKAVRAISAFLGLSIFVFGVLKLVNPFKGWYSVQIRNSGMSESLYWLGIAGEIFVGILFLGSVLFGKKLSKKGFSLTITLASATAIMIMVTAINTHLNPNVPANVLPLKIKPPFIPGLFLLLALADIFLIRRGALRNNRR